MADVVRHVRAVLEREYDAPEGCRGPWRVGPTFDTCGLLRDELGLAFQGPRADDLFDDLLRGVDDGRAWCRRDGDATERERLELSWERFQQVVRHHGRYFFHGFSAGDGDEALAPERTLGAIMGALVALGCVREHPAGTRWFRARLLPGPRGGASPRDLGPPLASAVRSANRMNPAGIAMFYGADDVETALREAVGEPGVAAVACFEAARPVTLVWLRMLQPVRHRAFDAGLRA